MEAHPTCPAIPPGPIAAPQPPPSTTTTTPPPPIAAPQEPAATVAVTTVRSPHPARFAFLVVAALMSASWFVEPFAAAAADLRVPWPAVVATLVCFAAFFCASVLLFGSFFMLRPPPGAAAVMPAQWKGVRAVAAVFAAVVVGVATCLVAAGASADVYVGMHQLVAE
ncbi:uncharacterized protein [Miscanthus floridulus]|uniref:uncharacterized protein n=1 Tax=Miscanthus floridulus TaxID=154761 RepID=UPI00345AE719